MGLSYTNCLDLNLHYTLRNKFPYTFKDAFSTVSSSTQRIGIFIVKTHAPSSRGWNYPDRLWPQPLLYFPAHLFMLIMLLFISFYVTKTADKILLYKPRPAYTYTSYECCKGYYNSEGEFWWPPATSFSLTEFPTYRMNINGIISGGEFL
jgi:hypothetical protein